MRWPAEALLRAFDPDEEAARAGIEVSYWPDLPYRVSKVN